MQSKGLEDCVAWTKPWRNVLTGKFCVVLPQKMSHYPWCIGTLSNAILSFVVSFIITWLLNISISSCWSIKDIKQITINFKEQKSREKLCHLSVSIALHIAVGLLTMLYDEDVEKVILLCSLYMLQMVENYQYENVVSQIRLLYCWIRNEWRSRSV